ncbi:MAG: hypothetical protein LBQ70_04135 [Prevotellaceae bacterium]|jgi:hypothetical protein|nr:hypothetical protein [Prevotellaceae bacterium]
MRSNEHALKIPDDVLIQAQSLAEQLRDLLNPYVHSLTPAERQNIPKMGEKTLSFVEKAFELAGLNPMLCPPYLNMSAFAIDFADAHNILPLYVTVQQTAENIDDTRMLAGSEAYHAALTFYNSVKHAASQDVPGAKAVYEALKVRFPRVKRTKSDEEITE